MRENLERLGQNLRDAKMLEPSSDRRMSRTPPGLPDGSGIRNVTVDPNDIISAKIFLEAQGVVFKDSLKNCFDRAKIKSTTGRQLTITTNELEEFMDIAAEALKPPPAPKPEPPVRKMGGIYGIPEGPNVTAPKFPESISVESHGELEAAKEENHGPESQETSGRGSTAKRKN